MLRKAILVSLVVGSYLIANSNIAGVNSNGSPPNSTGAPGELTCASAGCHTSYALNFGVSRIQSGTQNISRYTPNKTYTLSPSIFDTSAKTFGFQIVALNENGDNAGTFSITSANTTQKMQGKGLLSHRSYVTYKVDGIQPVSPGLGEWTFTWTSPERETGPVTFYLATVAGDGDHTQSGDYVYTTKTTLVEDTAEALSTKNSTNLHSNITLSPNPTFGSITLCSIFQKAMEVNIDVLDFSGKTVLKLYHGAVEAGKNCSTFSQTNGLAPGIYFLRMKSSEMIETVKFCVNEKK